MKSESPSPPVAAVSDVEAAWPRRRLEDLVDERGITYGVVQPGHPQADGTPILRVANLTAAGLQLSDVMRIAPAIEARYSRSRLRGGEVLITLVGSVGQVAVVPPGLAGWNVARAVGVVPLRPEIPAQWVAWCLRAPQARRYLEDRLNTTVQSTLNLRDLGGVEIPMPPSRTIRAITSILGALDDKIDSNRRLARLLEEIAHTEFQARFMDFIGVENLEDSELGPIPTGWHVGKLADLAGLHKEQVKPADVPGAEFEHFSIPAFDAGNGAEIEPGEAMLSAKTRIPGPECVLLSKLNPGTKRVWWPHPRHRDRAVCSPEFLVLMPQTGVPTSYLYAVASYDRRFYEEFLAHVTGTTGSRQRVKPAAAMSCRVIVPTTVALGTWDSFAQPLYDHAHGLAVESQRLGDIRDTLLPKLISGEIRVPDTADPMSCSPS
jgi:type I restriction enzyme, S subunit